MGRGGAVGAGGLVGRRGAVGLLLGRGEDGGWGEEEGSRLGGYGFDDGNVEPDPGLAAPVPAVLVTVAAPVVAAAAATSCSSPNRDENVSTSPDDGLCLYDDDDGLPPCP